jgi:HK97 family phage portal protein
VGIFLGTAGPPERRGYFPEPIIPPFLGADPSGGRGMSLRTNPDQAFTIPTVWACMTLLAGSISSLTLETYRRTNDIPVKITNPPLVASPDGSMTSSHWVHMLMMSLVSRGNGIGRIVDRDAYARPLQINLLDPDQLDITVDRDSGALTFKYKKSQQEIPRGDVWLLPGMTLPGQPLGLSPISYAAATLGVDLSSRRFANDFFEGGGVPKAVLKTDQNVTQEQARTIKERLMAAFRGREPIVLGAGLDYQMISVKPEESQFLATQQANVAQIARFFGVPPEMVGGSGGHSMTYANVEQRSLDFLTYTLAPWMKRIEDAISALLPVNQYVKFRTEDLIRTDAHTRSQVDMFMIAAKVKTPTEVRESMGLPPMTEAQKTEANMVPLGIGPLGRPTALPGLNTPPGPTAPTPADDQQGGSNG